MNTPTETNTITLRDYLITILQNASSLDVELPFPANDKKPTAKRTRPPVAELATKEAREKHKQINKFFTAFWSEYPQSPHKADITRALPKKM